ncbi:Crp/Fnr family transcriptional regulator [Deferribacterales bacterium Es71-Z0220]|uniref:Crp/Fnr family transcriptional regulator n=1 Tax=Deferrivibrio essentukiensis TaxID=2880922 RepID=UPI001F60F596|nr:Crp/Fnr family transcriptional regulator [Deferrivibrio essentukiensis]MCB4204605.1 Crp/Fnr family transcriptional regulator [Deferrivibrio essentukiensis]
MDKKSALKMFVNCFLGNSDEETFKLLENISTLVKKDKKEIFFFEDQEGENIYFLASGLIKLYKTNDEGKEAIIHFVRPGELFAEILLYLRNRYPVTAEAVENCTALSINSKKLFQLIRENPDISMKLTGMMAQRIKYFLNMIENLTLSDARNRLLRYLTVLADKNKDNKVILPASKGDIAILLGIAPETFSRLLKKLTEENIIKVNGKEIELLGN